jgi:putative ABC transport system substrate-binding protein
VKRREFIALVAFAAGAEAPALVSAQPAKPRVGVLALSDAAAFPRLFSGALRDAGYIDKQNVEVIYRSAAGKSDLLPILADELVRLNVHVIVAHQTPAARAAKAATSVIPIVMAQAGDPVGTGLVASLAQPGGNVTGVSVAVDEVAGKLVELVREARPAASRITVLANATDPFTAHFVGAIERAGQSLALVIEPVMARAQDDLDPVLAAIARAGTDALLVQGSLLRSDLAAMCLGYRLPALANNPVFPQAGGLLSYGGDVADGYRQAVEYVDKVLKGARPADLPIAQPTKFQLVVNLRTAKALGLDLPPSLLARADEVIE